MVSKLNTLCQARIHTRDHRREAVLEPAGLRSLSSLGALTFVTVVVSGIDYVLRYGRRAVQRRGSPRPRRTAGSKLT